VAQRFVINTDYLDWKKADKKRRGQKHESKDDQVDTTRRRINIGDSCVSDIGRVKPE